MKCTVILFQFIFQVQTLTRADASSQAPDQYILIPIVNPLKKTLKTKIHGDYMFWKQTKEPWKNGKSLIFQKSLTSLKRVQIAFWIVEKTAEECFNPNPKDEKNS